MASPERRGGRRRIAALVGFAAAAFPLALRAQMNSDVVPRERIVTEQEQIESDLKRSRLRLGPIRFIPGFVIQNFGYNSNVFGSNSDPQGDFTGTVGVGTKLVVPLGSKLYFLGDAYPKYTFYASFPQLTRWGGSANASLAGYFNRLSFQVGGRYFQGVVQHQTEEQQSPVNSKTERVYGNVDIELTRNIFLFGGAAAQTLREEQLAPPPPDQLPAQLNNRTDEAFQGGFRFHIGSTLWIAPEYQYTTANFEFDPHQRNNTSTGYLVGVFYNLQKLYINLIGGYREGRAWNGSEFPEYQEPVGSFFVSYFLRPWLEIQGFGERHVDYSLNIVNPYFIARRIGGGVNVQVAHNILLKASASTGDNDYPFPLNFEGVPTKRIDDLLRYGGGASVRVYKNLVLTAIVTQKENNSTIPTNSYSVLQFATFLSLSGEFMR